MILPARLATAAKHDAWIAAILSVCVGWFLVHLLDKVRSVYPDLTIVEGYRKVFGKWMGNVLSFLLIAFLVLTAASYLVEIGAFMTTQFMPETPIQSILILFLSIIILGDRYGLDTIGRSAELFSPWVIFLLVFLLLFLFPEIRVKNVQPILEEGFKPVIKGSIPFIAYSFAELVVFMMFFPRVFQKDMIRRGFIWGTMGGGIVLIIVTLMAILNLGGVLTEMNRYPTYVLAGEINIANFLHRIEVIIAGIWFITIFIKLFLYFHASTLGLAQLLNIDDYHSLAYPLGVFLIPLCLVIFPNPSYFSDLVRAWPYLDYTFGVLFPLFLLIGARIHRRKAL